MIYLQRSLSFFITTTIVFFGIFFFASSAHAATLTVNSTTAETTADGLCNLEEAIHSVNNGSNQGNCVADITNPYGTDDRIIFAIGAGGSQTIIGANTIVIQNPVIINGLSQDGLATCGTEDDMGDRSLYVTLDGFRMQITSNNIEIYGLVFGHNIDSLAFSESSGHHVYCNNFGFDGFGQDTFGIIERESFLRVVEVDDIEIGNADKALGNMFATSNVGSTQTLPVWNSSNVTIRGNRFGVGGGEDPDILAGGEGSAGSIAVELFNNGGFLIVDQSEENIFIQDNYIYSDDGYSIRIKTAYDSLYSITNVQIQRNTINVSDAYLDFESQDTLAGIEVAGQVSMAVINENEITNSFAGIIIGQGAEDIILTNNVITAGNPDDSFGIILAGGSNIIIGGVGVGNTIQASTGIDISPPDITPNNIRIQSNTIISTNDEGSAPIALLLGATNILIGGENAGEGNILQGGLVGVSFFYSVFGDDDGIFLDNIAIIGNTIDNDNMGIDWTLDTDGNYSPDIFGPIENGLTLDGVGPNRLVYYPVITGTVDNGDGTFTVSFVLEAEAGDYRIEWYRDTDVSLSEHGIGMELLQAIEIEHTGSGAETFQAVLTVVEDDNISATMTEIIAPGTNDWNFGATSQFSPQYAVYIVIDTPHQPRRSSGSSSPASRVLAQKTFADYYASKDAPLENILNSGQCPISLIVTNNMKQGDRNSAYSAYNNGTITQVALLQAHINRILAQQYNQASGPVDGIFGPLTKQGVIRLQTVLNEILKPTPPLAIDGIVGSFTKSAINESCGELGLSS